MRFEKPQLGDENVKFLSAMLTTILKSDDLKPLEIVHVFYGLSKMGYKWNAFTRTPRIALTTLIKRRVKEFDGRVSGLVSIYFEHKFDDSFYLGNQ